jgi:ParB family chromosome partitioning protein
VESATDSADRAFSRKQPLEQLLEGGDVPPEWEARRTLAGAFVIKIDKIEPDPDQPRKTVDEKELDQLANNIRALGILQAITVRHVPENGMYRIIAGERRYLAAKKLGLTEMPCWIQTPETKNILVSQVAENWQRADLHPFDLADSLVQMRDGLGYSQKEIAKLTGKPESEISKILSLLKLRPSVQAQCRRDTTGLMSRRHLLALVQLPMEQQEEVHHKVVERGLTAQETETVVRQTLSNMQTHVRRGAPVGTRMKFMTPKAIITLAFRKKHVGLEDVIEALNEAKRQAKEDNSER